MQLNRVIAFKWIQVNQLSHTFKAYTNNSRKLSEEWWEWTTAYKNHTHTPCGGAHTRQHKHRLRFVIIKKSL